MNCIEIKAPDTRLKLKGYTKVFLAGTIEMGNSDDWQTKVVKEFKNEKVIFYNPRRDAWDSSWKQSIENPKFKEQVTWELKGMKEADVIIMYLDPASKSPISLMELGLHSESQKIMVACPDGFWRKGNVEVVCDFYGIKLVNSLSSLIKDLKELIDYVKD